MNLLVTRLAIREELSILFKKALGKRVWYETSLWEWQDEILEPWKGNLDAKNESISNQNNNEKVRLEEGAEGKQLERDLKDP